MSRAYSMFNVHFEYCDSVSVSLWDEHYTTREEAEERAESIVTAGEADTATVSSEDPLLTEEYSAGEGWIIWDDEGEHKTDADTMLRAREKGAPE